MANRIVLVGLVSAIATLSCVYWLLPYQSQHSTSHMHSCVVANKTSSKNEVPSPSPSLPFQAQAKKDSWDVIACISSRHEAHNIREWIVWNWLAGIQHFVIYNNNDFGAGGIQDNITLAVEPFVKMGLVTLIPAYNDVVVKPALADQYGLKPPYDRKWYEQLDQKGENPLKNECYKMFQHRAKWLAFFDNDEYFTPVQHELNLAQMLALPQFESVSGVGVFWRIMHYSGNLLRPADGSVRHYRMCDFHGSNRHIKTIARSGRIVGVDNAHYMVYPPNAKCITENGESEGCKIEVLRNPNFRPTYKYFALNHYFSRSLEEFLFKSMRGVHHKPHLNHFRDDFAAHSLCQPIDEYWTKHMSLRVQLKMLELGLSQLPAPRLKANPVIQATMPKFAVCLQAIVDRKSWDDKYYLEQNQKRAECMPGPNQDSLLKFWIDGYNLKCSHRFY